MSQIVKHFYSNKKLAQINLVHLTCKSIRIIFGYLLSNNDSMKKFSDQKGRKNIVCVGVTLLSQLRIISMSGIFKASSIHRIVYPA